MIERYAILFMYNMGIVNNILFFYKCIFYATRTRTTKQKLKGDTDAIFLVNDKNCTKIVNTKTRPSQQNKTKQIFFRGTTLRGLTQPLNRYKYFKGTIFTFFYNGR
jgi:hypothetical protein